ncbi:MAG TPA: hypothetical protein VLV17_04640 [Anaeromyxobacteraceae bacterium]|nr:hypothetical protein [Anaeromyxobacteraceae bacterium]
MWFLLFGVGAASLYFLRLPAPLAVLPYPPPPEARYALYFLAAALLRLFICSARVRAVERRARRVTLPRPGPFTLPPPGLLEVGAGLGRGVAEAFLGDLMGVLLAGGALLLRFAASRRDLGPSARRVALQRRALAREKQKAVAREWRTAALCIVGVGLVCALLAWLPHLRRPLPAILAAARAQFHSPSVLQAVLDRLRKVLK